MDKFDQLDYRGQIYQLNNMKISLFLTATAVLLGISNVLCTKAHGPLKINTEANRQRSVLLRQAEDISVAYKVSKMYQPSKEYIPQLRQALQKLKNIPDVASKWRLLNTLAKAFVKVEDYESLADPDLSKHIPFTGYDSKRDFLKRYVEYLLNKNEHGLELLEYLWTSYGVETFNLGVVVYALDWEKKVTAAYENFNERAFATSFELVGDNFTEQQKEAMYQRNLEIIDKPGDARMKEFLLLKNKIRFGSITLEELIAFKSKPRNFTFRKNILLCLYLARNPDLFNQFNTGTIPPGKFPMIGLPDRNNIFDDVFLEYPELLSQLNIIGTPFQIQNYYARAVIKLYESTEDTSGFESFLMFRRGKVAPQDYRYLGICFFYSHNREEFAALLGRMGVIDMIDLLEFLFSSLALGNQNEYLSVIYEEFIHNPAKFQFNQNHQISIGPFYKYFADYRMLTILETQKINFKPLSIEDMVEILKYPPKSIPNYLQNELLMFDYGIVNSVLVTINDMKVLERLIEVFGIRLIELSIGRSNDILTPASKLITFQLLYQYKPSLLDARE